jgi:hypothetical protein
VASRATLFDCGSSMAKQHKFSQMFISIVINEKPPRFGQTSGWRLRILVQAAPPFSPTPPFSARDGKGSLAWLGPPQAEASGADLAGLSSR